MHPVEVEKALETLTVIVDTREQNTAAFRRRLKLIDFPSERHKLDFGDYSAKIVINGSDLSFERFFAIERKMSLDELCACYGRERARFQREFERAREVGAKMYLLVENATMENAFNGKYKSKLHRNALTASIFAWLARYECQLIFCKAEITPRVMREIIYREVKERLEIMDNSYFTNLLAFENAKKDLEKKALSAEEYQYEVRKLAEKYGI